MSSSNGPVWVFLHPQRTEKLTKSSVVDAASNTGATRRRHAAQLPVPTPELDNDGARHVEILSTLGRCSLNPFYPCFLRNELIAVPVTGPRWKRNRLRFDHAIIVRHESHELRDLFGHHPKHKNSV